MKQGKSALSAVLSAAVVLAVLFAASCSYDLLPEPEIEQMQGAVINKDAQIEAPLTVKATQGKTRVVTISWSTSNGATQYVVYSAASPHDEFQQIAETKGEVNSIDIQEPAGTSAYYRVCARNYKKELSGFSDTVFGSTMATPIISDITPGTDGTSATVSWWMENCSASTYQNLVNYVVYCYDESGNEVTNATASGKETRAVLSGLTANTRYFYQVEAFISADQSKPELSDKVDEETARRLIPDAPENLSATKGTDKETIAISWTLPPFCDVAVSGGVYERHPLYFTVERKLKGDDDAKYQKIVTYLGTQKKEPTSASVIQFSCAADGAATNKDGVVSVQPAAQSDADAERSDNYKDYISRSTVTYYDTTAERGLQYEYRVQSYVDDVKKTISAENATAVAQGFLLSRSSLSASAKYDYADDDKNTITNITVSFKVEFESYGQGYNYILCRNYEPMVIDGALNGTRVSDHKITTAESISTLNTTTDKFDFSTKDIDIGYYQYVLHICASGENDIANAYDSITMSGKITVIDKANLLPTITRFDIEDGYADKFRLTWNYESTCHYRLEWKSSLDGFTKVETLDMDKDGKEIFAQENGLATYNHEAQSGERRTYTLVANGGVEVSKTYPLPKDGDVEVPNPKEVETLGTAAPQTVDIDYRTVSVSWPEVQCATGKFDIEARYEDDTKAFAAENCEITKDADNNYHCVITDPIGFDDPKRSGLPITMKITAKSDKTSDTTTTTHTVYTLGPAALDVRTTETPAENDITITWKKAEGAEGYLIYRLAYTDRACNVVERATCYYYEPSESNKLEVLLDSEANPNDGSKTRAQVTSLGETYRLQDIYQEPTTESSAYQTVQSKLSWGRPYGYIVLPVKGKDDFTFVDNTATLVADGSAVDYTANGTRMLAEVRAATLGYGLGLVADKATSGSKQNIKWNEPYKPQQPVVYRRAAGSTEKFEKFYDNTAIKGKNSAAMQITDNYYDAFEYIVKYYAANPDGSSIDLPPSLLAEIEGSAQNYETSQGEKRELNNKGYLLTVEGFDVQAHPEKNYYEQAYWKEWDYSKRAVGPDSMVILVQNNNIDADKHELVKVEKANAMTGIRAVADDITAEAEGNATIRVAPAGIAADKSGTTDGMLKVLRDYRHNYTFRLERTVGETPISVSYEDYEKDGVKTAYRQITIDEFAKAAIIGMSTGIEKERGDKGSSSNGAGITGLKSTSSFNWGPSDYTITFNYSDYVANHVTKSGRESYAVIVSGTLKARGGTAAVFQKRYFSETDMTVKYETGTGTLFFNGKNTNNGGAVDRSDGSITVKYNGTEKTYDMAKASENGWTLPFTLTGGNLNNNEEWQ